MHKILEKKSGEVKFLITVDAEMLKRATDLVTQELSEQVKMPGFRPGKAPQFVVEKEVGKDRFWAEVVDRVVPEAYYEAVIGEKVVAISNPQIKITQFVPGEKLEFEATVATLPELKDLKYKDLKVKEVKEKITEKDVNASVDELLKRSAKEVLVDRAAKKGDKVEIDFTGTLKGLPFEGNESKNHPIILGSNTFVPGFEEKIEAHKTGDEFEFDVKFPTDYHAKNLAGEDVHFKVKLNGVYEQQVSKPDDEWAKSMGFETVKSLKEELEKQLTMEKELQNHRLTEEEMLTAIIEKNKVEAPETLTHEEVHRLIHEAEHNLEGSGLTMDRFLELSNKSLPDLEKEMKPEAERRVKIGIVLGEIARLEEVHVTEKEVEAEIEKITGLAPADQVEEIKAVYELPAQKQEIQNGLIIKKTLEKLWSYNVSKS